LSDIITLRRQRDHQGESLAHVAAFSGAWTIISTGVCGCEGIKPAVPTDEWEVKQSLHSERREQPVLPRFHLKPRTPWLPIRWPITIDVNSAAKSKPVTTSITTRTTHRIVPTSVVSAVSVTAVIISSLAASIIAVCSYKST
jgi:hypothetical protein